MYQKVEIIKKKGPYYDWFKSFYDNILSYEFSDWTKNPKLNLDH